MVQIDLLDTGLPQIFLCKKNAICAWYIKAKCDNTGMPVLFLTAKVKLEGTFPEVG